MSIVVIYPVQSALQKGMVLVREKFLKKIEDTTGIEIHYSSIRPTIFGSFDLRNAEFLKEKEVFLSVSRVRLNFSFRQLLKGNLSAIKSIQLDHPSVNFDITRESGRGITSLFSQKDKTEKKETLQIIDFLPDKADMKIKDGNFSLISNDASYIIHDINTDILLSDKFMEFSGSSAIELYIDEFLNNKYSVKAENIIKGGYSFLDYSGIAKIELSKITGYENPSIDNSPVIMPSVGKILFEMTPASFDLLYRDNNLKISIIDERMKNNASLDYNFNLQKLEAVVNLEDFPLLGHIKIPAIQGKYEKYLPRLLTGNASFQYGKDDLQYTAFFSGKPSNNRNNFIVLDTYGNKENIVIKELTFFPLAAGNENGYLNIAGSAGLSPFTPNMDVLFNHYFLSANNYIDAEFKISNLNNEIFISGDDSSVGQYFFDKINFSILPSDDDLNVTLNASCANEGMINSEIILNYIPMQMEAMFVLNNFTIFYPAEVIHYFADNVNFPSFANSSMPDICISTDIFITSDFSNISYNAPYLNVKINNKNAIFSFSGTNRQFVMSEGIISFENNYLFITANVDFTNPMDYIFSINANYLDLSWRLEGQILEKTTLFIRDPNGLYIFGSVSNTGSLSGYIEGKKYPIPAFFHPFYLDFYATFRYTAGDFWYLDINHIEGRRTINNAVQNLYTIHSAEYFYISGAADQNGAGLKNILYRDNKRELSGSVDVSWSDKFSNLQFLINVTDGNSNGENYYAAGSLKDNHLNIDASVAQLHLNRFIKQNSNIIIDAHAGISWTSMEEFNVNVDLSSLYFQNISNKINSSGTLSFTNNELIFENIDIDFIASLTMDTDYNVLDYNLDRSLYSAININMSELIINKNINSANAYFSVIGNYFLKEIDSDIELSVKFNKIDSWTDFKKAFNFLDIEFKTDKIHYGGEIYDPLNFSITRSNKAFSVTGGKNNMIRAEMNDEGVFYAGLSSPLPIRGSIFGNYKDRIVDAYCNDLYIDLSALWQFIPRTPSVNITGGFVTGKAIVSGDILNPDFYGAGRCSSLKLISPVYVTDELRPVPFNFIMEGKELIINNVPVAAGSGGGIVDGWLRFENWVPRNLGLNINIPSESPIPFNFNIIGFTGNGDSSGNISMILENNNFTISGNIYANNTELGLNYDDYRQAKAETDKPASLTNFIVDLSVTTGPMVDFIWPNTNVPILRANPKMGTVLNVSVDTEAGQYALKSDIVIRSGELYYFDRNFYIRSGSLTLNENEQRFNPMISAIAEMRDRLDSGPVTLSLIIENQPLFGFEPRFESSPALTQLEIYSLLGQNLYGTETYNENITSTQRFLLSSTTDLLTQFIFGSEFFNQYIPIRRLERQVRNLLKLDMFSIRTRLLQNTVTNVTYMGLSGSASPVDRNNRVGNYFNNSTVSIGKYVGQDMFIQGMVTMQYDENNTDFSGMLFGGMIFEPDIGIELQSPLFNIRWDFNPSQSNPKNWSVKDNSITIVWSRSY